jgi:transposase
MSGFVEGIDRSQSSLFAAELEDYVAEDNLVRAVDADGTLIADQKMVGPNL